jgi:hypothetical protein
VVTPAPRAGWSASSASTTTGPGAIEVWGSPKDAQHVAESSAPSVGAADLPAPTRVYDFEVSFLTAT